MASLSLSTKASLFSSITATMKLSSIALLATAMVPATSAATSINGNIHADSSLGKKLLSEARRLDGYQDDASDFAWVAGYSLKFQGCHHITQWNNNADDGDDVRLATKRLVRFRMCPSETCSASDASGCSGGYGDYILDLNTFIASYYENKQQQEESACEEYKENSCNCDNENGDDGFDEEQCEYDCFMNAEMYYCVQDEEYGDDGDQIDIGDYMECAQLNGAQGGDNGDGRRKLDEDVAYYVGPYCNNQGGTIFMGLFVDDTCTEFADNGNGANTFKKMTGQDLPYSSESIISAECVSCLEQQNGDNEKDYNDEDAISEMCEGVYQYAGKCEKKLPSGMTDENTNACNYIEGIKVIRENGILNTTKRPSKVATFFIIVFATLFAAFAFYVWYLRMRLGVKKTSLI